MKKYLFIAISLCALISCTKEVIPATDNSAPVSFTAGFDGDTKTMLNDDRSQSWSGCDTVNLYDITAMKEQIASQGSGIQSPSPVIFINNGSTPSASATFTLKAGQSFTFTQGHEYLASHNAFLNAADNIAYYLNYNFNQGFDYQITYCEGNKYGMPDNIIPVACKFTYSNAESLKNIKFSNISALCVVKVKNTSTQAIQINKIGLTSAVGGVYSWTGCLFGAGTVKYKQDVNTMYTASYGKREAVINCNNKSIPANDSCYFSLPITQLISITRAIPDDVTLKVSVIDGSNVTLKTETRTIFKKGSASRPYIAGDTKTFTITVTDPS